jgi:transposase InsO family protein
MGVDKTYDRLVAQGHKWPQMRSQISTFITKHCPCCQKLAVNKIVNNTQPFTLSSYDIMQRVACDSTGRLPKDANNNEYLISIIDHFSRFIEIYPVKDLTAKEFAKCLLQWIGRYGAPKDLVSDRGTQFCNEIITELCKMIGTTHVFTMRASKQENGIVERSIKEIRRHLRAIIFSRNLMDNWSTYLPLVQRILNADVKEALGVSPAQILFGNSIQLDRGILLPNMPNQSTTLSDWMTKMLQAQSEILYTARKTLESRDDFHLSRQHGNPTTFEINSYVLVDYIEQPPTTLHTNLEGPFRVVSSVDGKYTLQNLVTEELNEYHVSRLRPFYYDDEDVPRHTANRDTQQWDVDSIINHVGDQNHRKELIFRVRWLGHDESCDTWEPYSNLRHNIKLHDYLRANKMKKLIPKYDA